MNGSRSARPDARHLVERRLDDLLLAPRAVEVRLARVEQVLADARVDERPPAVHVLLPALEAPARATAAHRFAVCVGAVEAVRADRPRDDDVDPADRVDQLRKRSKSTNATWLTSSPVSSLTVRSASAGPPIWFAALIFATPDLGDLDLEVARDREEGEPALPGIGADEHDRVRAVGALAAGLSCRRRCRGRGSSSGSRRAARPVAVSCAADTGRDPVVRRPRPRSRPRGSSRRPRPRRARGAARGRARSSVLRRRGRRGVDPVVVGGRPVPVAGPSTASRASGTRPLTRPPRYTRYGLS